jgi:hypothetical protein
VSSLLIKQDLETKGKEKTLKRQAEKIRRKQDLETKGIARP